MKSNRLSDSEIASRLQEALQRFGYKELRPNQERLIEASIRGRDTLGVLPTSGGKSACYQIPGYVTGAWSLVISPLIALQEDQIQALRRLGMQAWALHSNLPESRKQAVHYFYRTVARRGEPNFLYLSPELLLTEAFHKRFEGVRFDRLAVDEAHCVSTWGDGFRPDYQRIAVAAARMPKFDTVSGFSAVIDPKIIRDIQQRIPLSPDHLMVEADPMRPNLNLEVRYVASIDDSLVQQGSKRFRHFLQLLRSQEFRGPTIVYSSARDTAVDLYLRLQQKGMYWHYLRELGYSTYLFHGNLPYEDKEVALRGFLDDPQPLVIATSAFGMGIDRSNVRQIIHYQVPHTLIDYAQQIGRAGRDGEPSRCTTLLYAGDTFDRTIKNDRWSVPNYDMVEKVHGWLLNALRRLSPERRRGYNLRSFLAYAAFRVETSEKIVYKETYIDRVRSSVAILQQVGIIRENDCVLEVGDILPGSRAHRRILEETRMRERMLEREQRRLRLFFGLRNPDQRLLWDILRSERDVDPTLIPPALPVDAVA